MEFSRQDYNGSPFSTPRDLPDPGIDQASLASPALAGGCLTTSATWEAHCGLSWNKAELLWLLKLLWIHPHSQDATLRVFTRVKSCSQVSVAWVSLAHQNMFLSLTTLSKVLLALLISGKERRKNRVKKKKTDIEILTLNFHLLSNPKSVTHLLFLSPLLSSRLFKTFSRLAQGLVWTIFHYQKKK